MKFETWDFGLLRVFFAAFAILADEMKVVLFGIYLRNSKACTVLPDVALLTCYTVRTVVLGNLGVNILNIRARNS